MENQSSNQFTLGPTGKGTIVSMTSLLEQRKDPIRKRRDLTAYGKVPTTPKS
jgi:hypothetical protein